MEQCIGEMSSLANIEYEALVCVLRATPTPRASLHQSQPSKQSLNLMAIAQPKVPVAPRCTSQCDSAWSTCPGTGNASSSNRTAAFFRTTQAYKPYKGLYLRPPICGSLMGVGRFVGFWRFGGLGSFGGLVGIGDGLLVSVNQ